MLTGDQIIRSSPMIFSWNIIRPIPSSSMFPYHCYLYAATIILLHSTALCSYSSGYLSFTLHIRACYVTVVTQLAL